MPLERRDVACQEEPVEDVGLAVFGDALERLGDLPVGEAENQALVDDEPAERRWVRAAALPRAAVDPG